MARYSIFGRIGRRCELTLTLMGFLMCAVAGLLCFIGWKTYSVACELTNPPFYKPQALSRVNETFRQLAREQPGGCWNSQEVDGLELWTLKRQGPSKGVVLLLHGFGDDRWGTSPAANWFPELDVCIFTYLRRDDALRQGSKGKPYVTFGAKESREVIKVIHHLEHSGVSRNNILLFGRSLGASIALLALSALEKDGPLGGVLWEGAPASSRNFAENLVRGEKDQSWHILAPLIGNLASTIAAWRGDYDRNDTDLQIALSGRRLKTPSLCFLATQDRLAPGNRQEWCISRFKSIQVVRVETWHLNCPSALGGDYAEAIRSATARWVTSPSSV